MRRTERGDFASRIAAYDWKQCARELNEFGYARFSELLDLVACQAIIASYGQATLYRKLISMEHHAFGRGEYKYFAYPLPPLLADLREALYAPLATIANTWQEQLRNERRYPAEHAMFLEQCHAAGQQRPTPLLLRYRAGDYNRLHQDLYGEYVFPLQATVLLSTPLVDFTGGEFVLTEHRARMQSRAEVVPLARGDAVIFPVRERPVAGARGISRGMMRHGVSRVHRGERYTLGIIFHDAN